MKHKEKKMKKGAIILLAAVLLLSVLCLSSCSKYTSKYKAIGFVHSNSPDSSFMIFHEFEGTMAAKMKNKNETGGQLVYSAKLETGEITVSCDADGTKSELFTIHSGEEINSTFTLPASGTVYVIVQTNGKCQNGDLHFDIN